MDKLTWYDEDGRLCCRRGYEVALARLASYEATELMPDEIVKMGMMFEDSKRYSGRLELKLVAAAEKLPQWVSVTERMPEKGMKLLLYVPKTEKGRQSGVFTGELKEVKANNGSGNFFGIPTPCSEWTLWGWSYYEKPNVTHWMPLPEPPKEVNRND